MDNRTGEIEAFLRTVDHGSFAAAAKTLRQTPSAVSRSVARLESRLGVQLLQRTTRSLTLTAEGEAYHRRAQAVLQDLDELERSFSIGKAEPRGRLRVNTSTPFGLHCMLPMLPEFLARHPGIVVDLSMTDAVIDLVTERTDVAIRHGPLRDSTLRARRLGSSRWHIVAAPSYLEQHGRPRKPADLDGHECLNFNYRRSIEGWTFKVNGQPLQRRVRGRFTANSGEALRLMAVGGAGIARLAQFLIEDDLRVGRLVPILESCMPAGDSEDIHAVYLGQAQPALRVRAFVDFLAERLAVT